MTTSVRFDDASFSDIQRRFREGRPKEAARRKRHSRYALIASLRDDIEQILHEGFSFDGIAEYLLSLDVRIPVPTLKSYVSLARRRSGDRRWNKDASASLNSNATPSEQTRQMGRIRTPKPRVRESNAKHQPITAPPAAPETSNDEARADEGKTPTTVAHAPEAAVGTEETASVDERSTSPNPIVTKSMNGHLQERRPGTRLLVAREKERTTDPIAGAPSDADTVPAASAAPMPSAHNWGSGMWRSARETLSDDHETRLDEADPSAPIKNEMSSSFAVPRRKRLEDL